MADEKEAKALRKAYGTKVKEWRESSFPDEVKGVSLGPALTLATRVRIAILQAIAKEIKECCEDTDSWVIQHVARPVLKVEVALNDGSKSISSFGFAQAVAYLNQNLPNSHLRTQQLSILKSWRINMWTRNSPLLNHPGSLHCKHNRHQSKTTKKTTDSSGNQSK